MNFSNKDEIKKLFNFIKSDQNDHIVKNDFIVFLKEFLNLHPGLEFLKSHPDFQEKYSINLFKIADAVIVRIFYINDPKDKAKISYRSFKRSNLTTIFKSVCNDPDINNIRDYFSYEHFYVLCCRFWELDNNKQNLLIDKEDFSKYN